MRCLAPFGAAAPLHFTSPDSKMGLCQIAAQGSGPHCAARSNVNAFERHQLMVNALRAACLQRFSSENLRFGLKAERSLRPSTVIQFRPRLAQRPPAWQLFCGRGSHNWQVENSRRGHKKQVRPLLRQSNYGHFFNWWAVSVWWHHKVSLPFYGPVTPDSRCQVPDRNTHTYGDPRQTYVNEPSQTTTMAWWKTGKGEQQFSALIWWPWGAARSCETPWFEYWSWCKFYQQLR